MKRTIVLLAVMLLTMGMMSPAAANGPADRQASDLWLFDDEGGPTDEVVGDARLVRTGSGVGYNLRTTGLEKGHATSIWWVIFNSPEHCTGGEGAAACGFEDLFDAEVDVAVMSGGGNAVGASGRSAYAGHLRVGEITNEHPAFQDGPGLTNPRGAEIHLVVRSHGPVLPGRNHAMFNSFEVGCTPETSGGFGDGPNACADLQFALFP